MCLDMLFIHSLLTDDGFGLKEDSSLDVSNAAKKITFFLQL